MDAKTFSWASVAALLVAASCGGDVIVDAQGSSTGGSGGSTTTTSTGTTTTTTATTSTTTSTSVCAALLADFKAKLLAARSCNPFINAIQCDGSAIILDECDCPALANETNPGAVDASALAHDIAAQAGCFAPCAGPCSFVGVGYCNPSPDGMSGLCTTIDFP